MTKVAEGDWAAAAEALDLALAVGERVCSVRTWWLLRSMELGSFGPGLAGGWTPSGGATKTARLA